MSRAFNFSAGPAALPEEVLRQAREECLEWGEARASVMEISHRGNAFVSLAAEAERDLRELLRVPPNYKVLFLQGGATQHFAQIPMNLCTPNETADYIVTGAWGQKAVSEGTPYVDARVVVDMQATGYTDIPDSLVGLLNPSASYVHYTPNETIHGVEFHDVPVVGEVPLVGDFSSTILSREVDVSKFGLIYAGAQKNIGPSGLVLVIVREDLVAHPPRSNIAKVLSYSAQAANDSMLNTPPTFAWYLAGLVFKWLKHSGGLVAMEQRNIAKAQALYRCIDHSAGFFRNPVAVRARSRMNVPFTLHDSQLDGLFLSESSAAGLLALKGHKAVGGMRASIYNAMPLEGVLALTDFMSDFARRHG